MRNRAADAGRAEARARFGKLVEEEQAEPQAGDGGGGVPDLGQGARGQRVGDMTSRESGRMEALRRFGTEEERAEAEAETPRPHTKFTPRGHDLPPRPEPRLRAEE